MRHIKRGKAVKYFNREWRDMETWFNSYLKSETPENLHQFRIQVKKLHGFLILADRSRAHRKLVRYFKPIKKIFKYAGKLRDAYIGQTTGHSRQPAETAAQDFRSHKDKYWRKIREAYCRLIRKIKPIKIAAIAKFYETQLRQIADLFLARPSDRQLHECRKRIKVLLYNEKLVHNLLPIRINVEYLDLLQEMIGDWHDQTMVLSASNKDTAIISKSSDLQSRLKVAIDRLAVNFYQRSTNKKIARSTSSMFRKDTKLLSREPGRSDSGA